MRYAVRIVGDKQLPVGHDWALIEMAGERLGDPPRTTLVVKESANTPAVRAEAWGAYRQLLGRPWNSRQDRCGDMRLLA